MPDSYPYIISNNKLDPIFSRIRSAAKPERFSRETLATWGFTASNDRAMTTVLKELGFLNEGGVPTQFYDRLRDPNDWKYVLAERVRQLYSDLFAIDANIQSAPEAEIKGAISRVTGKDDETVKRYYASFKALAALANFEPKTGRGTKQGKEPSEDSTPVKLKPDPDKEADEHQLPRRRSDFHYNIQIHLPVTTDISVYNAIFKSLKENLGI
jgi:hypothetical protein